MIRVDGRRRKGPGRMACHAELDLVLVQSLSVWPRNRVGFGFVDGDRSWQSRSADIILVGVPGY